MSNEANASKNPGPDLYMPAEGWPAGLFPSPIVDEYFNPYENAQDKLDYYRLGGRQAYILQYATIRAVARQRDELEGTPGYEAMVKQSKNMVDNNEKRQRIKNAFRPSQLEQP